MPIYAYRCAACGHAKDVLQKVSDPLLTNCPACGADAFRKQVTAAGFHLKGSGWYVTDFKGGAAPAPAAAAGDGKDGKTEQKDDGKVVGAPAPAPGESSAAPSPAPTAAAPGPAPAAG